MPLLKPFAGISVKPENIAGFATPAIEHYTPEQLIHKNKTEKKSFINIIFPTIDKEIKKQITRYNKVRRNFEKFIKSKYLIADKRSIYIYEQIKPNGELYRGILGLTALEDVQSNKIKKHEEVLPERVEIFTNYLENVHFQAEPILLTYPENSKIDLLLDFEMRGQYKHRWRDEQGNQHKLWKIDNHLKINQFKDSIEKLDALYIADGHHRLASTIEYSQKMKAKEDQWTGNEPYNYILSFIISDASLKIIEYNRLIKDLNGLSKEEFIRQVEQNFTVIPKGKDLYYPSHRHHISMYLDGEFYGLYVKHELRGDPVGVGELDTFLFEKYLLKPILGIEDPSHSDRIRFEKGTRDIQGIQTLKDKVNSGEFQVAFGFYPLTFKELKKVSDLNQVMPAKSTYIEPKLQSGVVIFDTKF